MKKIRLSAILFILCISAVAIRISIPDVMNDGGIIKWLYISLLFAMLPVVTLLGHYGGKLSAQSRQSTKTS
jgi:hypothetical protein